MTSNLELIVDKLDETTQRLEYTKEWNEDLQREVDRLFDIATELSKDNELLKACLRHPEVEQLIHAKANRGTNK